MDFIELFAIAVALAMDAFAVAVGAGITLCCITKRQTFRLAWHFGLFQALMPVIGWGLGYVIQDFVAQWAHWIAFVLLTYIGVNMLREAFDDDEGKDPKDPTKGITMVGLAVATSIDALAVGTSLSMLGISIWFPAVVIGVVAFVCTAIGMHLGCIMTRAALLGRIAELAGGAVLVGIGLKILYEHDVFSFI